MQNNSTNTANIELDASKNINRDNLKLFVVNVPNAKSIGLDRAL
jgi:hypothetical protein